MAEGGSAQEQAAHLRAEAAAARQRAESLEEQARRWEVGAAGERLVAAELRRLPLPWVCLHDRLLRPGRSRVNLDHVAIGPAGVFLIDTKNWSGGVSEYDGTLWQHTGSSRSQRASVEQVGRAAGEMERSLEMPVVPVIALAGSSTASFEPRRVGGIDVVPLDRLRAWLASQPGKLPADHIELMRRRIDHAFPPASESTDTPGEGATATTTDAVPVMGTREALPERVVATGSRSTRRSSKSRPQGRSRRRARLLRGLVGLALLAVLASPVLQFILYAASRAVAQLGSVAPESQNGTQSSARALSCQDYPASRLKALVASSVTPSTQNTDELCTWYLGPPVDAPPSVVLQIGTVADIVSSTTAGQGSARAGSGTARVWVAADRHVRQWKDPSLLAPASFMLSIGYGYPKDASASTRRRVDEGALGRAARLSEDLARWMRDGR